MSTEITKIGFEKCLGQLTKSKDKVLDTLKRDEQNLADARKTLQKAKNENDRRCKERIQNTFDKNVPFVIGLKILDKKILKFKKAHHKAKKNYNKYLNTKDEDKYRIVYTDKQALYESSTEEYTLQVEKFNQAQVRVIKQIYLRTSFLPHRP